MWLSEEFLSFSCRDNTLCCAGRGVTTPMQENVLLSRTHFEYWQPRLRDVLPRWTSWQFWSKAKCLAFKLRKTRPTLKLKWLTPNSAVIAHHCEACSLFLSWRRTTTLCIYSFTTNDVERVIFYHQSSTPKIMVTVQMEPQHKVKVKMAQVTSPVWPL